jgi:hypothetical protein
MALSNNYDFVLSRNEIIEEAFRLASILDQNETPTSTEYANAAQSLNIIMKQLMSTGVRLWRYTDTILLPTLNTSKFTLRASGGARFCLADQFVETTVNGATSGGATTVIVDDATGIASSDQVGFYVTSSKSFEWATVSSVSTNTITVPALTNAITDGAAVYSYPASTSKPLKISDATLQIDASSETVVVPVSQREWRELSIKTSDGNPTQFFYKPTIDEGEFYMWPQVDDELKYINLVIERQFDDFDSATDNPATPNEYYQIMIYTLAHRLAIQYGFLTRSQILKQELAEYKAEMAVWDHQEADMKIEFDSPILGGY